MKINEFVPDNNIFTNVKFENNVKNKTKDSFQNNNSFSNTLKEKLNEVNEKQIQAEDTTEAFVKGDVKNVHKVMLKTEEAKLSLELAVQIRNKMVEAYQELNRMQL